MVFTDYAFTDIPVQKAVPISCFPWSTSISMIYIFQFILGELPDAFLVKSRCKKKHLHKYMKKMRKQKNTATFKVKIGDEKRRS